MDGQLDTSPSPAAPVTNWERQCVTLAGYCYAVRHGLKVQLVTPYSVSLLQRYGVTVRGNVTSVYRHLDECQKPDRSSLFSHCAVSIRVIAFLASFADFSAIKNGRFS